MRLNAHDKGYAPQSNSDARFMSQLGAVQVEISVLLGRSKLPIHQFLRMGRGAVIPLDAAEHDEVWILANNHPIARGEIIIQATGWRFQSLTPQTFTTISLHKHLT